MNRQRLIEKYLAQVRRQQTNLDFEDWATGEGICNTK